MPLQLLLLLTLLGPGSSHLQRESGIPGPPLTRARRDLNEELGFTADEDYEIIGTDPPEMIENSTWALSQNSEPQAVMGTVEQRVSVGPGTPEPATVGSAGLDAGTATMGNPDTELTTQGIPATQGSLIVEPATEISSMTEAPTREGAPSMEPATMEALSTEPATTEALSTQPTATMVLSTKSVVTEALSTEPTTTEALSTEPTATEALSTEPITTEALSTEPAATEGSFVEPSATVVLSTEATTTEATSTEPATTRGPATSLLMTSDLHYDTTVAPNNASNVFIHQRKDRQGLWSRSSVAPGLTRVPDRVPVKQCLLAILILALVATIFLVCTVVLAIRLSRKTHTYPVRNYSPTEMVCISSLLPDGAEAPAPTANGRLPKAKSQGPQADREGDDLTLQSFLP